MLVFTALVGLSVLLYAASVAIAVSLRDSDPAGNALSHAYGLLVTIALWLVLSVALAIAERRGAVPPWAVPLSLVLIPAAGASALAAVQLLSDSFYRARWPLVVCVGLPLLVLAYSNWAYFPALHAWVPGPAMTLVTWGAVLALAILPWPSMIYRACHGAEDRANATAAWAADETKRTEAARQENAAAFNRLAPGSSLEAWLEFAHRENALREQALAGIRALPGRQSQVEDLLRRGHAYLLEDIPQLNLAPSPAIATAASTFLLEKATELRPHNPANVPNFTAMAERVHPFLPLIRWLATNRLECRAELEALEASARAYPDSAERDTFLARLAQARQGR